jgi:hypothetical protein
MRLPSIFLLFLTAALLAGCAPAPGAVVALPGSAAPEPPAPPVLSSTAQATAKPCGSPAVVAPLPSAPADRGLLAAGLASELARQVQDERTVITPQPAPFLVRGKIWEVEYGSRFHPMVVQLGEVEGGPTAVLSSSAAFLDFARRAGLALDDEARRTAYVRTYLSMEPRYFVIVEALSGIPFTVARDLKDMKNMDDLFKIDPGARTEIEAGIAKRREIEERHGAAIKPLCLRGTGPFRGAVHAIADGALVRLDLTLDPGGAVAVREEVLVTGVPLPMVVR